MRALKPRTYALEVDWRRRGNLSRLLGARLVQGNLPGILEQNKRMADVVLSGREELRVQEKKKKAMPGGREKGQNPFVPAANNKNLGDDYGEADAWPERCAADTVRLSVKFWGSKL